MKERTDERRLAFLELLSEPKRTTKLMDIFKTLVVTGGYSGGYLDTTEIFRFHAMTPPVWEIGPNGRLPQAMEGSRIANLDNRLLLFGQHLLYF